MNYEYLIKFVLFLTLIVHQLSDKIPSTNQHFLYLYQL
ncbi:unnamed protein product [Schistosoma mattheei]|uniref:Uncharacterized protein n=1 Tax=Schistosoma mattheei TaxID=31246 RepID=A0A3P8EZ64_9TREM|nr:unnamed protein product [Schistosoma mattheei]